MKSPENPMDTTGSHRIQRAATDRTLLWDRDRGQVSAAQARVWCERLAENDERPSA